MCFYDDGDYDWIATVSEESERLANRPMTCNECGGNILTGAPMREIYQQEHEACQICEDANSDTFIDDQDEDLDAEEQAAIKRQLESHACDFGETFLYRRCEACDKLIKAIEAREIAEGCPPHARKPALMELNYAFTEHESNFEYAEQAVAMFPELWDHVFIRDLLLCE